MTVTELKRYGLEEMRPDEIDEFLEAQSIGVLGLPASDSPYLLPLSFGYQRDDTDQGSLYLTYLLGENSRKEDLTERAKQGQFLVYDVESMFYWKSVLLTGSFEKLAPSDWETIEEILGDVWRPEMFETADTSRHVAIYEFEIDTRSGIKHTGLARKKDKPRD